MMVLTKEYQNKTKKEKIVLNLLKANLPKGKELILMVLLKVILS